MKIIEVEWLDACMEDAHINLETAQAVVPMVRKNVGYCVNESDSEVVLAYGLLENAFKGNTALDMTFAIPRGCIRSIKEVLTER